MNKVSLNVKVVLLLLVLFIVLYNYLIDLNINMTILNLVYFLLMTIISYILLGYTKNRSITKKQTIQYIVIYCLIYFLIIYFLGIITGFNFSPFSNNILMIIKNIFPVIFVIISKELIRYMLIFKNRFNKTMLIIINIIFILLDISMLYYLYDLSSAILIFVFIGEVIIRTIYNNLLESIISYNTGPAPSILYRIIIEGYVYFVPIIPNLGVYLSSIINIILPVFLIICLNKLSYNYKNISKKRVSISKKYITISLSIVLIAFVFLVSGSFKYTIVAVASNSMLPKLARGDAVIYEKVTDLNKLSEGEILVFKNDNTIYIHRITEIVKKDKDVIIYTKGDNNADNDLFTTKSKDIIGIVKYEIKYIGYPSVWISELF